MNQLSRRLLRFLFLCGLAAFLVPLAQQELSFQTDEAGYVRFAKSVSTPEEEAILQAEPQRTSSAGCMQAKPSALEAPSQSGLQGKAASEDIPLLFPREETVMSFESGIDLATCLTKNPDFIAWLRIPGTAIDYPVVQSGNTEYCLHHLFNGKKSSLGCLFSLPNADYETPGRNIAIYGHHLRTGDAMFSNLIRYKKQDWLEEHQEIALETLHGRRQYRIFAVINFSVGDWNPGIASMDAREFRNFLQGAKERNLVRTDVTVSGTDHILTLITCDRSYGGVSGRLAVLAVQEKTEKENP